MDTRTGEIIPWYEADRRAKADPAAAPFLTQLSEAEQQRLEGLPAEVRARELERLRGEKLAQLQAEFPEGARNLTLAERIAFKARAARNPDAARRMLEDARDRSHVPTYNRGASS